jgi:Ran GTPase-activating protein (RanGAP) involved in mRNA processing and transport
VPLPKEEKRFFPALSGRFSGGELRLSIGERGDGGWRKREPPPGTGPYRAIKDAATGNAPALIAAASGHTTVARALLQRDVSSVWADVEREHRWTLLHTSARWNDKALMEEALKHAPGSESMRDAEGLFPVELAALHQQKDVLAALLERDVVREDSFAPLKDLLTVFPKVLDLSERKPPLGPRNAELLSGLLLVLGEGCHELNLRGQNLQTSGSKALAKALKVTKVLKVTNLLRNELDAESAKLLAEVAKKKGISLCGIQRNQTIADFSKKKLTPPDAILLGSDLSQAIVTGGLTSIDLFQNQLCGIWTDGYRNQQGTYTAEGITAIADALRVNGARMVTNLLGNQLDAESAKMLAEVAKQKGISLCGIQRDQTTADFSSHMYLQPPDAILLASDLSQAVVTGTLTRVDVRRNNFAGDGAAQLAAAILGNLKIEMFNEIPIKEMRADLFTELDLNGKGVGVEGVMVVAGLIPVMGALTSLDLSNNSLCGVNGYGGTYTAEGAAALAPALAANGTLTRVDVRRNNIAGDGAAQLAAAVLGNLKIEMFNEIPIQEMRANSLTELDLNGKAFGVEGSMVVAGLMPVMGVLTMLSLTSNTLGEEGTKAICEALEQNKTLKELDISGASTHEGIIGRSAGAKHVAKMLGVNGGLTSLNLRENQLCGLDGYGRGTYTAEGITAIADALRVNGALTELSIYGNRIGDEGVRAICEAIQSNKETKLASLYMGFNKIGPVGATSVAAMVAVTGGLTALDLSSNDLKDDGVSAVFKAIQNNKETKLASLNFSSNSIGPGGANAVAAMVAVPGGLTSIDVRQNNIAGDGAAQLAAAVLGNLKIEMFNEIPIQEMRANSLTELDLKGKDFGVVGGMVVANLIPVMGGLTSINLSKNHLTNYGTDMTGVKELAAALGVNGALTALDLSSNDLKDEGVSAVCEAIQSNKETKLASLNFKHNGIGPVGSKSVTAMVAVTGGLTSIDLSNNRLCGVWTDYSGQHGTYTAEGITAIADAMRVNGGLTKMRYVLPQT